MAVNQQLNADFKRYVQRPTLFRDVASLDLPALFLYGAGDIRPTWAVAQIAALLPRAWFILLAGADHYLYETHRKEVRTQADAFLRSLPSAG
jgi:proline iminopeptidase